MYVYNVQEINSSIHYDNFTNRVPTRLTMKFPDFSMKIKSLFHQVDSSLLFEALRNMVSMTKAHTTA